MPELPLQRTRSRSVEPVQLSSDITSADDELQSSCEQTEEKEEKDSSRVIVAARFRPFTEEEEKDGEDAVCVRIDDDMLTCHLGISHSSYMKELSFTFDNIFPPTAYQEDVYLTIAQPIVDSVCRGINGAILVYGQTGSGKTHTMLGPQGARILERGDVPSSEFGIIPRALNELFEKMTASKKMMELKVSYLEIYQENVHDLLADPRSAMRSVNPQLHMAKHTIRERGGGEIQLPSVTETLVTSPQQALDIMRQGNENRATSSTDMNKDSSRSHAIFIVSVTSSLDRAHHTFAQLYMVDLAGNERVEKTAAVGMILEEAKLINRSLLALGQVIWALAHHNKHVPYRDSKLTRVLQNCLGGNAQTAIVVTASTHVQHTNETVSTLRFGNRASKIRNRAHVNIATDPEELKRLLAQAQEELAKMRDQCVRLSIENELLRGVGPTVGTTSQEDDSVSRQTEVRPEESKPRSQALNSKQYLTWALLSTVMCPISHHVMRDPVIACDGWSYDRGSIERYFLKSKANFLCKSPITGKRFLSRQLVPNCNLQRLVEMYFPATAQVQLMTSGIFRLQVFQVQIILSFLDPCSLCLSEAGCSNFFAAADGAGFWDKFLQADFPWAKSKGPVEQSSARAHYAELALHRSGVGKTRSQAPSSLRSQGLVLRTS